MNARGTRRARAVLAAFASVAALLAPSVPSGTSAWAPGAVVIAPRPVLPALSAGAAQPVPAVLAARLAPVLAVSALGTSMTMDVVDVAGGRHLAGRNPSTAHVAASTIKLLTGTAALSALGPGSALPTTVVAGASPRVPSTKP